MTSIQEHHDQEHHDQEHHDQPDASLLSRRSAARSRAFLGGRILFNGGNSTVDCQIREISENGAKLRVSRAATLPAEFDLQILQQGVTRRARMAWRTDTMIGVAYVDVDDASTLDLQERLVRENRELKEEVARLQARIQELSLG
jgi:hypothetical protein